MTREQKFRPNHEKFFFRPKNYNFCQATKNRPEISISGQIMTIYIIFTFWGFNQILTLNMTRGQKFRPNKKKNFFRPQNYNFYPAAKNRPEISISGQIMVLYIIFQNRILGHFLTKFEFGVSWMAEISATCDWAQPDGLTKLSHCFFNWRAGSRRMIKRFKSK